MKTYRNRQIKDKSDKVRFFHTLLFKMIMIFFATSLVPAAIVVGFIPQYYTKSMTENINLLTNTVVDTAVTSIRAYVDDLKRLLVVPYMDSTIMDSIYTLRDSYNGKEISERQRLEARRILNSTLPSYTQYAREDIVGTLLCFNEANAMAVYNDRSSLVDGFDFGKESWYQRVLEADGRTVFISTHQQSYLRHQKNRQVFSMARLIKDLDSKQPVVIIKIDVDKNLLSAIMEDIRLNVSSVMTVLDRDGQVLYSNKALDGDMKAALDGEGGGRRAEQTYRVISHEVEETGWTVKALVSETEYTQRVGQMQKTVVLLYLIALSAAILVYCWLSGRITRPLKAISRKMAEVENGNFDVRFHVQKKDEIAVLGNSFNVMTEHLNRLINREYKAVIAAQRAEYFALQSQIEPHFLYNVLNTMIGINRMGDKKLLEETIYSLAGMLRYMTRQTDTATVREEFDMLEKYCSLQKLRLQKRLSYTIEAQDEVKALPIPKLLVQPLVENAVIHGIEPTGEEGEIEVRAYPEGEETLCISVADTGCGFSAEEKEGKGEAVGIENVRNRLHLFNGKAELHIDSAPGEGCRVLLRMPAERRKEEREEDTE